MTIAEKVPIHKGWSGDTKYRALTSDGQCVLLRISPASKAARVRELYGRQREAAELGIPTCDTLEIGECDEGIYTIQRWIEGRDANEVIPELSQAEQIRYGKMAGCYLRKLHTLPVREEQMEWGRRFRQKIDRKITRYRACGIRFDGDDALIEYLEQAKPLLDGRPQCFQHGDYHTGNMMIDKEGTLVIIDFEKSDYGDPWEEFNRVVWCVPVSHGFTSGMIDAYFEENVPELFWRLLVVYIGSNTLSSIPWAVPFGEQQLRIMLNQAKDVMTYYDDLRTFIPSWYRKTSPE